MPWTDSHSGFSPLFINGTWRLPTCLSFILMQGHLVFDIYPQTMSNTIDRSRSTVSQPQYITVLPSSWPADHKKVQSPDLEVSSAWPGRILHYLLFTLYTGGQRKCRGPGRKMPQHSRGQTRQPVFRLESSCYCGCFTQEWHWGPQRKKSTALLHRAIGACRLVLMKDYVCKRRKCPSDLCEPGGTLHCLHCKKFPARHYHVWISTIIWLTNKSVENTDLYERNWDKSHLAICQITLLHKEIVAEFPHCLLCTLTLTSKFESVSAKWGVYRPMQGQGVDLVVTLFLVYERLVWTGRQIWPVPCSSLQGGPIDGWALISSRQTCHRKHLPITFTETSPSPETRW